MGIKIIMVKQQKIIICGTGRCGTMSMKTLLESCKNSISTHEFSPTLPWIFNNDKFQERLKHFKEIKTKYYSDTGAWYLNYLESFIQEIPDIKIICLIRDKTKTIVSYKAKYGHHNFWNHKHTDGSLAHLDYDNSFPNYGDVNIEKGLNLFWDDYYSKVQELKEKYPKNIVIVDVVMLNSLMGQIQLYEFIEIDSEDRVNLNGLRENAILNL